MNRFAPQSLSSLDDWLDLEHEVGAGAMGAVYRARMRATGERVAVKVMHERQPELSDRFQREARILARLWHPGIVRYVAHGTTRRGNPFLAMEWLEGETLAERLARSPLSPRDSLRLARRLAEALAAAHRAGVVHRDLKPSNLILLDGEVDRVKLLDFGVARLARGSVVTHAGSVVGTPAYMAPEQARGATDVDSRADVFSIGCVLFECLTGEPVFRAAHPVAVMAQIVFEQPRRLRELRPDLPVELEALVARMLSKDPAGRPVDAAQLAAELGALGEPEGNAPTRRRRARSQCGITDCERRLMSVLLVTGALPTDARLPLDGAAGTISDADEPTAAPEPALAATVDSHTSQAELHEGLALYQGMHDTVQAHAGRFTPLADGSLVAVFTADGSATDLAGRAAHCALALRNEVPEAPMALATTREVLGNDLPVGQVLERQVARLRRGASAEGGCRAIHIDEVTTGLLDARFDIGGDEGGLRLRGKRELADAPRQLVGRPSPWVGRSRELSLLGEIARECADEPVARAVLITAAAGIGKTRLRQELQRRLAPGVELWSAQGEPTPRAPLFDLLGRALRRGLGIHDTDSPGVQRGKLRARVGRHFHGSDLLRVSAMMGEIIGVPFADGDSELLAAARLDAALMHDQQQRAWLELATAECEHGPVVLILEDVHWADQPSLAYIDLALRHLRDLPLFVLATARPEVHERFPRLWFDRGVEEIRLHALRRSACTAMIKDALGADTPRDTVRRLVDQSSGNAYYLEELIRAHAAGAGDELPPTMLAMVQSRLESFPDHVRRVLRAASVLGDWFTVDALRAILAPEPDAEPPAPLDDCLRELVEREVLLHRPSTERPGESEYAFVHAYAREAARGMLTARDRELAEQLAAAWRAHADPSPPADGAQGAGVAQG